MASISLPPQSQPGFPHHFDTSDQPTAHNRRLTMPAPLPNPPFVFPARDVDASDSQLETPQPRTPPPLPAFSFNPGSGQPSHSDVPPVPPVPANYRPSGHRRRPSEFVGGEQLISPGPLGPGDKPDENSTSAQSGLPPPGPGVGRSPGRRHHAHRRSTAVSGVDLKDIAKALGTNPAAGSAPCTPGDRNEFDGQDDISRPISYSATTLGRPTPPASPRVPPVPTAIHVEPAPDNDSSDVGRSVPAISHEQPPCSITINLPPPEAVPRKTPFSPADREGTKRDRKPRPRPKTADASLAAKFAQSSHSDGVPSIKRSKSSGHSRARTGILIGARKSHDGDDARSTDTSRASHSDDDGSDTSNDINPEVTGFLSARSARAKKKQKRVRSWAGSILTRSKGKRHPAEAEVVKKASTPTPPPLSRTNSDVGSVNFDDDNIVVLRTPTNPNAPSSQAEPVVEEPPVPSPTLETSWKPRSFYEQGTQEGILSSPIIDLDAALGPFNTPGMDMRSAREVPSNFSVATQRMYSGGRRGEFIGPEMRYHRRAESAPTLPPFDKPAVGANRLGGATTMECEDVFDEEEEDAFLAANGQSSEGDGPPVDGVAATPLEDDNASAKTNDTAGTLTRQLAKPDNSQHAGLGIQEDLPAEPASHSESAEPAKAAAADQAPKDSNKLAVQSRGTVEILKADECASRVPAPPSPDVSPRFVAVDKRPATSPLELAPSVPPFSLGGGVSPSDSSFPFPVAPRSITTASTFDRNFSSLSYHFLPSEGPHASMDDVPSLTSSASTTTNTFSRFSATFFPRSRLTGDRAASFSAAVHRRTSEANAAKRSSMVSLSKLVGGSHSERSKLSYEEKPPGDAPERAKRKARRISRLMHFWKVKDKDKMSMDGPHDEPPP